MLNACIVCLRNDFLEDRREHLEAEMSRLLLLREQEQDRHEAAVAALQSVYDKYKDEDGFLYMTYR